MRIRSGGDDIELEPWAGPEAVLRPDEHALRAATVPATTPEKVVARTHSFTPSALTPVLDP